MPISLTPEQKAARNRALINLLADIVEAYYRQQNAPEPAEVADA